jgi:hypothetical protein
MVALLEWYSGCTDFHKKFEDSVATAEVEVEAGAKVHQ